jgi:Zn-dependent protease
MADDTNTDPLAERTRANLAYLFGTGVLLMLGYILYRWGDKTEILTLIIGIIGGTILGGIFGVYFAGTLTKKPDTTVTQTGDSPTTNVTPSSQPIINNPPVTS